MNALHGLGRPSMIGLAEALESGRLLPPFRSEQLRGQVPGASCDAVAKALGDLAQSGMGPGQIGTTLRLMAGERASSQAVMDRVSLVWSGTKALPGVSRDTAVVVRELFREARSSVLVVSYALDSGPKGAALFGELAARMDREPELRVRMCVNVHRPFGDSTPSDELLGAFAKRFRSELWAGERLPRVFHDPRSLATDGQSRACLHAKCVVVDDDRALITSANFTEAAHARNIEAGTLITDTVLSKALRSQFEALIEQGQLLPLPGL